MQRRSAGLRGLLLIDFYLLVKSKIPDKVLVLEKHLLVGEYANYVNKDLQKQPALYTEV